MECRMPSAIPAAEAKRAGANDDSPLQCFGFTWSRAELTDWEIRPISSPSTREGQDRGASPARRLGSDTPRKPHYERVHSFTKDVWLTVVTPGQFPDPASFP